MELLRNIMETALPVQGFLLTAVFLTFMLTSFSEKEDRAAYLSLLAGILTPIPYLLLLFAGIQYPIWISLSLAGLWIAIPAVLFFPYRGRVQFTRRQPARPFDERDTMFSRRELVPGTERFDEYYARRPGNKPPDNKFRRLPGLLKAGTKYYDPMLFAAADSIFSKVEEELHPRVEGVPAPEKKALSERQSTDLLLRMAVDWGAHSAGITELKDTHVYSVGGRGDRYGIPFKKGHSFALALTVEMDYEMMRAAPAAPAVLESARQYLQGGLIAVQLAEFIRALGYPARAHIDGNYQVVCPPVARDAGLGEIGRMGLLMTPRLGPRCRIAVVTTDLPLLQGSVYTAGRIKRAGHPERTILVIPPGPSAAGERFNRTLIDFCRHCRKCARVCPSRSIPFKEEQEVDGVKRWKIDSESCYAYWCQAGTDCGRCMIVCPFSHPDNRLHRFIRTGIRNNVLFRRLAVPMDDLFYGKSPEPKPLK